MNSQKNAPREKEKFIEELKDILEKQQDEIYRLTGIINELPIDVYWKDGEGVYLGMNEHGRSSLKRMNFLNERESLIGKTDQDIFPASTAKQFRTNDLHVMRSQVVDSREENAILPSGEEIIQLSMKRPLRNGKNKIVGIVGCTIDITELKKQVEAANQAKTEFIANMSHDLRTPMTGVMGMLTELGHLVDDVSGALVENPDQVPALLSNMKQFVKVAGNSSDELLVIFNEILEVVRLDSDRSQEEPEHFNLWQVIKNNYDLFSSAIQHKNISLSINVLDNVPMYLCGMRLFLDRILVNLLSNALKFTEEGSVTIHAALLSGDPDKAGDEILLRLCVEDTGMGIPEDKFEDIFGHFSRLTSSYKGVYKGSGLGLYAVKKYVDKMKGSIRVESLVGEGSRFIVELPFTVSDHADKEEPEVEHVRIKVIKKPEINMSSHSQDKQGIRVLLTEDNLAAAMVVMNTLKRLGYSVDHAKTGEEAIQMATSGDYALIFMDVGLPGVTGLEASQQIRDTVLTVKHRPGFFH